MFAALWAWGLEQLTNKMEAKIVGGKDVMEGAKTNEAAADEFYESMRY